MMAHTMVVFGYSHKVKVTVFFSGTAMYRQMLQPGREFLKKKREVIPAYEFHRQAGLKSANL